ncbi:hypothetical protein DPMN_035669 [Dreissena polymorpha]|uniref:Uncharacterized protein n=1 Tax=Dreissena polymorpha TaxID=45954 RepID=A0A9D4M989_DREPO|nr:hypothetical protein DPMN_035669 [Dreissena polymorpha]
MFGTLVESADGTLDEDVDTSSGERLQFLAGDSPWLDADDGEITGYGAFLRS